MSYKPLIIIAVLSLLLISTVYSQDKIVKLNGDSFTANIIAIEDDIIKFKYPEEDLSNCEYKNAIRKIIFKSGRVQFFNDLNIINGIEDWKKVRVTTISDDVKGLIPIREIDSKATGTTYLSNVAQVENRAIRKLKQKAAMMGSSVVYITYQTVEGVRAINRARTTITGIAYKIRKSNPSKIRDFIVGKKFNLTSEAILDNNALTQFRQVSSFEFTNDGKLIINNLPAGSYNISNDAGELKILYSSGATHTFDVVKFSDNLLVITEIFENKVTSYSFSLQ